MKTKKCFIIGLPAAGKTTYLAALSYSAQQKKVLTCLKWPKYSGDHQYLAELSTHWLTAQSVSRTSIGDQQENLHLHLVDEEDKVYDVSFPDLSGEVFQNWYENREMDAEHAKLISECNGMILFINPDSVQIPEFVSKISKEFRPEEDTQIPRRNPRNDDPTEVVAVELLQFIVELRLNEQCRLAIVISAWDRVKDKYNTPIEYVSENLPLLFQYLVANQREFTTKYFGVSAQGDAFDNEKKCEELVAKHRNAPAERILVVDDQGNEGHDITLPLWSIMNS